MKHLYHFAVWPMYTVYLSNSKMIQVLYDYDTRQDTLLHTPWALSYDLDINSYGNPVNFYRNLSLMYQISWPNCYSCGFTIQGSWFRVPLWTTFFHFLILASHSSQLEKAHANEIKPWHTYRQSPVLDKGLIEKIWLSSTVVYSCSC